MEKSKLEKKLNTREILLIPFVPENIIIIVVVVVLVVMPIVITGSRVHRGAPSVCDNNDDDDDDDVIIYEILLFVFLRYLLYIRIYLYIHTYRYPRRSLSLPLPYPALPSLSSIRLAASHRRLLLYRYIILLFRYRFGLVQSFLFGRPLCTPQHHESVCASVYTVPDRIYTCYHHYHNSGYNMCIDIHNIYVCFFLSLYTATATSLFCSSTTTTTTAVR